MNTRQIIALYQTYSLAKISELSRQSLIAQYAQCEQLERLRSEVALNTAETNQLFKNQIKELERQEKVRYYKNLVFNLRQALAKMKEPDNANVRVFLASLFVEPVKALAEESIRGLEDIQDKEYAQSIIDEASSLAGSLKPFEKAYDGSCWERYLDAYKTVDNRTIESRRNDIALVKKAADKSREEADMSGKRLLDIVFNAAGWISLSIAVLVILAEISADTHEWLSTFVTCLIFGSIFALSYRHHRKYRSDRKSMADQFTDKINRLYDDVDEVTRTNDAAEVRMKELSGELWDEYPVWESLVSQIAGLLPHEEVKEDRKAVTVDNMFEDAARLVVVSRRGSTSDLQRRLGLGYAKACRVLEDLEAAGIVGPQTGQRPREVLVSDLAELEMILDKLR